jgi:Divergent InlB B-repeat domain
VKGRTGSITVHMDGPLWESATFEYRVFPPPAVYTLTVTETGLPHGVSWNISAGAGNASAAGATTSLTLPGLNGSYTLTVATIYPSVGTRFLANGSSPLPVTVTANRTASVAFQAEYALTVSGSLGGTVSGGGTSWESSGASATLTATPAAGYTFVSWNGTTNSTSARLELTTSGPVNETASFAPVVAKSTTGSASAGQGPALALLAALLAVGLVAGLVLGRRSGRTPPAASSSEDGDGTSWTEDPGADSVPADSPGDDIYGENAPTPAEPYDEGVP